MTGEFWQQVQRVVDEAMQRAPGERAAYVERACVGNPELRREVESLLSGADDAADFIEQPVVLLRPEDDPTASAADAPSETAAPVGSDEQPFAQRRIGSYRTLRIVGSGGMGTVYLAVRDDEFEKQVAIKVLKRGMDTDEIVRRFRHERQILANLDHPNIAKLLDGGTTDGLPYFVMEYVEGEPLDRYCDHHRLSTRQRLELFRKVCSAVHFAHQNLVVHRDLKPSNILVTQDGEPKLLDFGIAKLLESEPHSTASPTLPQLTTPGLSPMTPRIASPEQIYGEPITTASDVYSLGVVLYYLLTGHRPYRLENGSKAELFRAIREQDPHRPSTVVLLREEIHRSDGSISVLTPKSVSETREGDLRTLRRRLSGDLDYVVLKALRKEPKERYSSAEQFSDDVRRHLAGLPVAARQGTFLYYASKFARRHALKLAATAAVLLMLFFGVRSIILGNQAERERQVAQQLSDLYHWFLELDPTDGEDEGFAQDLRARVERNIDDLKLAEVLNDQAIELEEQGGLKTAEIFHREALAMKRRLFDEQDLSIATSLNNLGVVLEAQGEFVEAEEKYRAALEIRRQLTGGESEETARTLNNLGALLQNKDDLDAAEPYLRASLEIRKKLYAADAPEVGIALNNWAFFLQARAKLDEAEAKYRQALRIFRTDGGPDDPRIPIVLRNLATVLQERGDAEGAARLAADALEMLNQTYLKPWRIADAESVLGRCLVDLGRAQEAEPLLNQSYTVLSRIKGKSARHTEEALKRLEYFEAAQGKDDAGR